MIEHPATTFAGVLVAASARRPDRLALVDGDRRLTYRDLDTRTAQIADALIHAGIGPGDVVTSRLTNSIESVVLCFAVCRVGAVHNPVLATHGEYELVMITQDARSALLVDSPDHEIFHRPSRGAASPLAADDGASRFLMYTSGSSSRPKGVLHSDATLLAECSAQAAFHRLTDAEVFVVPSSVAHVSGLIYGVLLPIFLGATAVLMARWDPAAFLALVESERATFCAGAPAFLQGAADHPDIERRDLSSLRIFPVGGADVPAALVRRAAKNLGVRTGRGYGSTEFPSVTSTAGPDTPDEWRATTDGRPIGANEVRIVDGAIEARGPELFCGYTDPALDVDAFTEDGWFRTGDLGVLDAEGYLTVTGRRTDIIIRLGENISARELEVLIGEQPTVRDVAVVAIPDLRTGERACVCVVPADPASPPTLVELTAELTARGVSRRKHPETLVVVDALPATPGGKVDKHALRALIRENPTG